jgi:hypothetical protein
MKKFYLYKIINLLNNKIYIGKRGHKNPHQDKYMGSGVLIKQAIKKYGLNNFKKEILHVADSEQEINELEKQIVNEEFVSRKDTYNLRYGGEGGFDHINKLPKEERVNFIEYKRKLKNGEIKVGGDKSRFFTEESYRKIREGSKKGLQVFKNKSEEEKKRIYEKRRKNSIPLVGEKNPQYGKKWCVKKDDKDLLGRKPFLIPPDGWITISEWKNNRKKGTTSYSWYNNGNENFFLKKDSEERLNLKKGRINMKTKL